MELKNIGCVIRLGDLGIDPNAPIPDEMREAARKIENALNAGVLGDLLDMPRRKRRKAGKGK